jgi:predicted aconitase
MLEGEEGEAIAKAMELLIAIGEIFEAGRLITVDSAHISGVSFKNLGNAGLEWLEEQVNLGARCRVKATLNPAGMDMKKWRDMKVPESFAEKQYQIIRAYKQMGVETTCTCTPYLIGHVPGKGRQIAWAESNAICYSNSVLGARTNRESGLTTLASAVTGLTPLYGYRLDEGRKPTKIVEVEATLKAPIDYSALGYITGKLLGNNIPYFKGLGRPDIESMKTLGAACATSGSIALWHGEDVTSESIWASQYITNLEKVTIEETALKEAKNKFRDEINNATYCIGCPHCSLEELEKASKLVKGKSLEGRFWIFTSDGVYHRAKRAGYVDSIEDAGGRVYKDTCMVVAPLREMGWEGIVTNSFKGAHYSLAHGFPTKIALFHQLIEEASK